MNSHKHYFPQNTPFMERIHFEPMSGCWIWGACSNQGGYGLYHPHGGDRTVAHRYSYIIHKGPIAEGMTLDHLCRNTSCVNPDHLEEVTMAENLRRGNCVSAVNARKTKCILGHELEPDNRGSRFCRECGRRRNQAYKARNRAEKKAALNG